ncbi:thiol-disulfide oxidoreductase [Flavobacterium faecale]|uniref:Thiol-disulfide oxidoreductase n=1 Tax=Flavobacterium faecale TaxID=1355330 RepID=A0A2S1LFL6_9FLAO|nr:thiol-disulfide oxidoreductase DCC family protein [Flavobacterium faecale]AWG22543.1 thiol-disulfide oxidoreductase [Flavobacterium faecale]
MINLSEHKKIILFDGLCNLCNTAVNFVIARDKADLFRFVALQSELGKEIIKYIGIDTTKMDSIILYEPQKAYYYKSQAALKIAVHLGGLFPLTAIFQLIPTFLSDWIYDYVAKNRYRWFGKKDSCMIPTPALSKKFLS